MRVEASGKFILIGCYGDTILLNQGFPSTLPSLHFHINVFVPQSEYMGDMKVEIYFPGDTVSPSLETQIPQHPEPPPEEATHRAEPSEELQVHLMLNLTARPMPLSAPGFIRVRGVVGDKRIRLGDLKVMAAPEEGAPVEAVGKQ